MSLATATGETADVVGLSVSNAFRTNFYACGGPKGASLSIVLVDPDGTELASRTKNLGAWMPFLANMVNFMPTDADYDNGTLRVTVTDGSAVVGASKVDEASTDPTTLESSAATGECSRVPPVPVGELCWLVYCVSQMRHYSEPFSHG